MLPHRRRADRAFTLVEVVVVLVVLAILATVGLVAYGHVTDTAADRRGLLEVTDVAREAAALAASDGSAAWTEDEFTTAAADAGATAGPALATGTTAAAARLSVAIDSSSMRYGTIGLTRDGATAGLAMRTTPGHCALVRITLPAQLTAWLVNTDIQGACAGSTALSAQPGQHIDSAQPIVGIPAAPTGLTLTPNADASQLTLTWTPSDGAAFSTVYRSTDGGATWSSVAASVSGGSWTDTTATTPGTTYTYAVTGTGAHESARSTPASFTQIPAAPTGVAATLTGAQPSTATITWARVPGATAYRVYAQTGSGAATLLTQVTDPTATATDPAVASGTTITYSVSAVDAGGESAATPATPVTAAPATPAGLTATASGSAITVSWTASSGASDYVVTRTVGGGVNPPPWTGSATGFTDSGLNPGSTTSYTVAARNAGGTSPASASVSATVAPAAPSGLTATAGDNTVTLAWSTSTGATGYRVYRSADGATFTYLTQTSSASYADSTVVNGTSYWYAVSAYNAAGESVQSAAVTTKPLPPLPAVPTGVQTSVSGTTVTLSWAAVSRADGYRIYKNGSSTVLVQTAGTSTTDPIAVGGTASYTVSAYNLAGESAQSSPVSATAKPAAPTGVNATASSSALSVTVTWTASSGATGYTVYWTSSGSYSSVAVSGTSKTFTGLAEDTTYTFYVTASNAAGDSPASATDTATTTGTPAVAGDLHVIASSPTAVAVFWQPATDAASYVVQRSADGSTGWTTVYTGAGTAVNVDGGYLQYTNTGLTTGSTYYYRVLATNPYATGAATTTGMQTEATPSSNTAAAGTFDGVSSPGGNSITVAGWTFTPSAPLTARTLHITIDAAAGNTWASDLKANVDAVGYPASGSAAYSRADVLKVYPGAGLYTGWNHTYPGITSGTHQVCVTSQNGSASTSLGCRSVTVP